MPIQALSTQTVRLLASTQVVTSVVSVIKELVENSLDAGASNIDIKLVDYGFSRIEVRDNGCGIAPEDAEFMGQPHFTSKISDHADLEQLETYGFRGEALGSLCAVSEVSIITRRACDPVSMMYQLDVHGKIVSKKPSHQGQGTTVIASDLFKKLPVRKQYYGTAKNKKEELRKVCDLMYSFGVIWPNIRISLRHNKELLWQKNVATDHRSVMLSLLGGQVMGQMANFKHDIADKEITVLGLLPKCDSDANVTSRASNDRCFVSVNRRPVQAKEIQKLLKKSYCQRTGCDTSRWPIAFIKFELQASAVDVNLDPNKTRVLLHDEDTILEELSSFFEGFYAVSPKETSTVDATKNNNKSSPKLPALPDESPATSKDHRISVSHGDGGSCAGSSEILSHQEKSCSAVDSRSMESEQKHVHQTNEIVLKSVENNVLTKSGCDQNMNQKVDVMEEKDKGQRSSGHDPQNFKIELHKNTVDTNGVSTSVDTPGIVPDVVNISGDSFSSFDMSLIDDIMLSKGDIDKTVWTLAEVMSGPKDSSNSSCINTSPSSTVPTSASSSAVNKVGDSVTDSVQCAENGTGLQQHSSINDRPQDKNVSVMNTSEKDADNLMLESEANQRTMTEAKKSSSPLKNMDTSEQTGLNKEGMLSRRKLIDVDDDFTDGDKTLAASTGDEAVAVNGQAWSRGTALSEAGDKAIQPVNLLPPSANHTPGKSNPQHARTNLGGQGKTSPSGESPLGDNVKKPCSAYIHYAKEIRKQIQAENPGASFQDLARKIAEKWRSLTDEEKEKFEDLAVKDRERYNETKSCIQKGAGKLHPIWSSSKRRKLNKVADVSIASLLQSPKASSKSSSMAHIKTVIARFNMESLRQCYSHPDELSNTDDQLMVVGQNKPKDVWYALQTTKLLALSPNRAQETLIYQRLMEDYICPVTPLENPIILDDRLLGGAHVYQTLMQLQKTEKNGVIEYTDPRFTKNGFQVREVTDNSGQRRVEVTGITTCISSVGMKDLREVLETIQHTSATRVSECRPVKLIHYLQGEAVRMARQLPGIRHDEVCDIWNQLQHKIPAACKTCFHNRPFQLELCDVNSIPDSQTDT